jgi:probable HAF family extracellular repeat protein
MRLLTPAILAAFLTTAVHAQSPRYLLKDLGTLPGATFSQASDVTDSGIVAGISTTAGGSQHAVLWIKGGPFDLPASSLGGPNSGAFGINEWGQISIQAETATSDPYGEDFCAYGTHLSCRAARWDFGFLTMLRTLGGSNATVGNVNNFGQIPGVAETSVIDSSCAATVPFQVLRYKPVIWDPGTRVPRQLPLLAGDTVGFATVINDRGQAVGFSGACRNSAPPPIAFGPHAVLWETDGSVRDLGNLGSAVVNIGLAINNRGQVVGTSSLAPDSRPFYKIHAFLWTQEQRMTDLGTVAGDVASVATNINDAGEVIGVSADAAGNIRAFHWQRGTMEDLNSLVPEDSALYLLFAQTINASGTIVGFGVHKETGEMHAFQAIPDRTSPGR